MKQATFDMNKIVEIAHIFFINLNLPDIMNLLAKKVDNAQTV